MNVGYLAFLLRLSTSDTAQMVGCNGIIPHTISGAVTVMIRQHIYLQMEILRVMVYSEKQILTLTLNVKADFE